MRYNRVVELVNTILFQYTMPLTLRQIFYRLVANFDYPNTQSAYSQLSKQLVRARERNHIDETRMEDRSREFLGGDQGFDNPKDFLDLQIERFLSSPEYYYRNMWTPQPEFVIVWIEKDALSRVVSTVADKFNVMTCPSRGYASYTYIMEALTMLPEEKEITVLHFADHDPSGLDMTRDLEARISDYSNLDVTVERVALNHNQVQHYELPPNPTKHADPRAEGYVAEYGNECWELDAIDPDELQRLVSQSIIEHIDVELWDKTIEEQEKERQWLEEIFSEIRENFRKMGLL